MEREGMDTDDVGPEVEGGIMHEPDQEKFETLREWIEADLDFSHKWRARAKKNFEFLTNEGQWEPADRQWLSDNKRPMVTFNLTAKFVKSICGLEANNRHETVYMPREVDNPGEVHANEVLSAASQWMGDNCHADRHQSRAFRDMVVCGMGWTEAALSFDDEPRGEYVETRCDPLEMGWDRNARDQNLMDAKRVFRVRKMLLSEARNLLPGITDSDKISDEDLDAHWASSTFDYDAKEPKTKEEKELRAENSVQDDPRREVHIVQIQWWEYEPYWLAFSPQTGGNAPMDDATYQSLAQANGGQWPGVAMRRKKYKQAFVGNRVLQISDCPRPDGFTLRCMTGDPEDITGYFTGIVDLLRDPAMWSNKFLSQALHMLNSTAKGGIIVEQDAIGDVREFLANYAKAEQVSVVQPGAIGKGKIMGKPGVANLSGVLQLYEIAKASFQDVSGLNLEIMGLADRQQPGILEAQRKQAAMTILATMFDSLSLFRIEVGRCRLHYLQTVLADGRLVRVVGPDAQLAIPLIRDQVMGKYDVIVEDAPTSPNTKEKTWATIQMLLPPLLSAGMVTPPMVLMLLDYVPFMPSKLVQALKKMAEQPNPGADEAAEREARKAEAEIEDLEQKAGKNRAAAILDLAKAGSEAVDAEIKQQAVQTASFFDRFWPAGREKGQAEQPDVPQPGTIPTMQQLGAGGQPPIPQPTEEAPPAMPDPGMIPPGGLTRR